MHATLIQLPQAAYTPLGSEVCRGLTGRQKSLSPWLFYDAEGSRLFEEITELPEYYVTRTEREILHQHADAIVDYASAQARPSHLHSEQLRRLTVIELGAGTATKTGLLLAALVHRQGAATYYPIDISATALEEARKHLLEQVPGTTVEVRLGDYTDGLGRISAEGTRRLVLYIGSSMGNFEPAAAQQLLKDVRQQLAPGDMLLLGLDLVKPIAPLIAAYDDAKGTTAAFNKNVLTRLNQELGANFNLSKFRHKVRWNGDLSRIEMHLESLEQQIVSISALDLDVPFRRGETIHTENSYKYTPDRVTSLLAGAGYGIVHSWTDPKQWFGEYLARVV